MFKRKRRNPEIDIRDDHEIPEMLSLFWKEDDRKGTQEELPQREGTPPWKMRRGRARDLFELDRIDRKCRGTTSCDCFLCYELNLSDEEVTTTHADQSESSGSDEIDVLASIMHIKPLPSKKKEEDLDHGDSDMSIAHSIRSGRGPRSSDESIPNVSGDEGYSEASSQLIDLRGRGRRETPPKKMTFPQRFWNCLTTFFKVIASGLCRLFRPRKQKRKSQVHPNRDDPENPGSSKASSKSSGSTTKSLRITKPSKGRSHDLDDPPEDLVIPPV